MVSPIDAFYPGLLNWRAVILHTCECFHCSQAMLDVLHVFDANHEVSLVQRPERGWYYVVLSDVLPGFRYDQLDG